MMMIGLLGSGPPAIIKVGFSEHIPVVDLNIYVIYGDGEKGIRYYRIY